jgi:hypothetical protein
VDEKRGELRGAHQQSLARGEAVRRALREVQAAVEAALCKQYKGRAVHVIGEINNVLG